MLRHVRQRNLKRNMESNEQFNAPAYFKKIAESNKYAKDNNFKACFCSGIEGIQGVLQSFRKTANFVMIDDTTAQNTHSEGVGYFDRNTYTVFILAAYREDDMEDRQTKLNICRKLFRQIHSRIIYDRDNFKYGDALAYLDVGHVYSKELSKYAMNGVTGLYFMVNNEEPVDLTYNVDEWEE